MNILLLGATGYIGSAVADRFTAEGHRVIALVRPGETAGDLVDRAHEVRTGDLTDPRTLTAAVTDEVEAVVHLATPTGAAATDLAAIDALLVPLAGTGRALVYTSGVWVLGATGPNAADEDAPTDPIALVGYRPEVERRVLESAPRGVRSLVIRPGVAHGRGGGIPALLADLAAERGHGVVVGAGDVTWPMVHVDDLAELFALAVERGRPGTLLHGVAEEAVPVVELARAAAAAAGATGDIQAWPLEDAATRLGHPFAEALGLSQACSGARARDLLGWAPRRPGAVADLRGGSYARPVAV